MAIPVHLLYRLELRGVPLQALPRGPAVVASHGDSSPKLIRGVEQLGLPAASVQAAGEVSAEGPCSEAPRTWVLED